MSAKKKPPEFPNRLPWIVAAMAGVGVIAFLAGAGLGGADTSKPPPPPDKPIVEAQPPEQPRGDSTRARGPTAGRRREARLDRSRGKPEFIQPDKQGPRRGGGKGRTRGKRPGEQEPPPERPSKPATALVDGRVG